VQVYLAREAVDLRKSFDSLAAIVRDQLGHDVLGGSLFVFRSRNGQKLKILFWDGSGLTLYYKRLERHVFRFPAMAEAATLRITAGQLRQLVAGLELSAAI
jgi:transposase